MFKILVFYLFVIVNVVFANEYIERLLDEHEEWFNRRVRDALNYQFPTDARVHEPLDTVPRGNIISVYFYSIFIFFKLLKKHRRSTSFLFII